MSFLPRLFAWWVDALCAVLFVFGLLEPLRILAVECAIPLLVWAKLEHYRDPVRLVLPFREAGAFLGPAAVPNSTSGLGGPDQT